MLQIILHLNPILLLLMKMRQNNFYFISEKLEQRVTRYLNVDFILKSSVFNVLFVFIISFRLISAVATTLGTVVLSLPTRKFYIQCKEQKQLSKSYIVGFHKLYFD